MESGPHALFVRSITRWADKELRIIDAVETLGGIGTRNRWRRGSRQGSPPPARAKISEDDADAGAAAGPATPTPGEAGRVGRAAGRATTRRDDMHLVLKR